MSDLARAREAVDLVFAEAGVLADNSTIAHVLLALDGLHLLRDFEGTPAEYMEQVQEVRLRALREVTE